MKAQLIDLGRNNVNKTIEVKDTKALHKEIGKHILSKGWDMEQYENDPDLYEVTAGFRTVGKVRIIEE